MNTIRFFVALVVVMLCRLVGIQIVRPTVSRPAWTSMSNIQHPRAARRPNAEAAVNLGMRRAWFVDTKLSSISGFYNPILEDALFVARDNTLMAQLVTPYSGQGFMTRKLSIYPQLSAVTKPEGDDFANATEFTKTSQATLTPGVIMVQVVITDEEMATDPENTAQNAAIEMGNAIATKIDTDLVGLFSSFSAGKGSANSALALSNCAAAIAVLRNNKVPMSQTQFVVHPYHWHDIWLELGKPTTNFVAPEVANQALRDYFMADANVAGARWYTSANISVDGSDDAVSAVFNRGAIALDTRQQPELEPERDASKKATELNMSAGYAFGIRRNSFGVKITADATEPT
jgi:hypothetical protein